MKKALIWIAVLLVVILGTGTYLAYNHLDYLVKLAVEYYGTDILKTDVQVDTVRIKAADGRASIKGFTIDNPDGFKSASAFGVSKVSVDLDMKNSTTDKIIIDKILIRSPGITYEVNQDLKSNLSSLLDNVNSSAAGGQKNRLLQRQRRIHAHRRFFFRYSRRQWGRRRWLADYYRGRVFH